MVFYCFLSFYEILNCPLCFFIWHSIKLPGTNNIPRPYICFFKNWTYFFWIVLANNLRYWKIVLFCKFPVALIMRGYSHNGPSPVTRKHIICNIHRDLFFVRGIYRFYPFQLNSCFLLCKLRTLQLVFFLCLFPICFNLFPVFNAVS